MHLHPLPRASGGSLVTTIQDELLIAALEYAEAGQPVFMLGATKRPLANCGNCRDAGDDHDRERCPHLTCHGFYAATTDPDRVRAMRGQAPRGLLAIRTGAASGLVVIDIDTGHGGRVDRELMTPTGYVRTGSGGWHLYYRHPGFAVPNSQSRIAVGVDVRGDGGYVVAPPSIHPRTGRRYEPLVGNPEEMPSALVSACLPPPAPMPEVVALGGCTATTEIAHPDRYLSSLLDTLDHAPEGKRRTTLYGVAQGFGRAVRTGVLSAADARAQLTAAGLRVGQSERETRRAIEDAFRAQGVLA